MHKIDITRVGSYFNSEGLHKGGVNLAAQQNRYCGSAPEGSMDGPNGLGSIENIDLQDAGIQVKPQRSIGAILSGTGAYVTGRHPYPLS